MTVYFAVQDSVSARSDPQCQVRLSARSDPQCQVRPSVPGQCPITSGPHHFGFPSVGRRPCRRPSLCGYTIALLWHEALALAMTLPSPYSEAQQFVIALYIVWFVKAYD